MLKQLAINIVCLQETYLKKKKERYLWQAFGGHVYRFVTGQYCTNDNLDSVAVWKMVFIVSVMDRPYFSSKNEDPFENIF